MKRIIFLGFSLLLFVFAFIQAKPVECELTKAFVNPSSDLAKLAALSSSYLNVILETDNEENLEELKHQLPEISGLDVKAVTDVYRDYPENFLTEKTRKLLENKNYSEIEKESLERLYSPLGIFIAPPDNDPYLLATEYVLKNTSGEEVKKFNGKFYLLKRYKIKNKNDIEKFLEVQKNTNEGTIYLSGPPVHSYITGNKSFDSLCEHPLVSRIRLRHYYDLIMNIRIRLLFQQDRFAFYLFRRDKVRPCLIHFDHIQAGAVHDHFRKRKLPELLVLHVPSLDQGFQPVLQFLRDHILRNLEIFDLQPGKILPGNLQHIARTYQKLQDQTQGFCKLKLKLFTLTLRAPYKMVQLSCLDRNTILVQCLLDP